MLRVFMILAIVAITMLFNQNQFYCLLGQNLHNFIRLACSKVYLEILQDNNVQEDGYSVSFCNQPKAHLASPGYALSLIHI